MRKVSIIVPVYNSETYLSNCLDTLTNQTYENLEILLVNDGSRDNSLEICEEYANKDHRINLFSIPNSGVSTARNLGLDHATGDYITFVDSDDWVELDMIEYVVNKAEEHQTDIVVWSYFKDFPHESRKLSLIPGGDQVFYDEKDILYLKSIYQFYGQEKLGDTVSAGTTWCKLYKKEVIQNNNIRFKKELTRSQDVIFCLEAFSKARMIHYFDVNFYHYRINNSSTCSGSRFIEDTKTPFDSLLNEMERFSLQFKNDIEFQEVINARTVQVILWHLDHKYFHMEFKQNIFQMRKKVLNLINNDPYKNALRQVNKALLPKREKTMVMCLNKRAILLFYVIYKLHKTRVLRSTKKFD